MPQYTYECTDCGHTFTELQGINDKTEATCPECKKVTTKKIVGDSVGIKFKGHGFYVNGG